MIEADLGGFGSDRKRAYLDCPYCGNRLRLVAYVEGTGLDPA
jgi:hypothetical protein